MRRSKPWPTVIRVVAGAAVVWGIYCLRGNIWSRLYPVVVTAAVFSVFLFSLWRTPLIEVFARRMGEELDPAGVEYCRRATVAWVIFLGCHLAVTVATLWAPLSVWAWYNGFFAYMLIGAMFLGEFLVRKHIKSSSRK